MNNRRPKVKAKLYAWRNGLETDLQGIGLVGDGRYIRAHLTRDEAYALANEIVDLADTMPDTPPAPIASPRPTTGDQTTS